jgi:P27 family predicted phage terminase small subunit
MGARRAPGAGRKPKPIEQRIAEGRAAHRPLPQPLMVKGRPDLTMAEPPDDLPEDAKDLWRSVVPSLLEVGILDVVDLPAMEAMCTEWAYGKEASRIVAEKGVLSRGHAGQLREHPAVSTVRKSHEMFARFAAEYGLTPSARARLGLAHMQGRALQAELQGVTDVPLTEVD